MTSDGEVVGGDCASPDVWCRGMPEICDDLSWQYVGYVGCDPYCVDRTVAEGGGEYPFGTSLSEPLCVITDDTLSGTIYDYDDVNDNTQDYFDYDDPCDYEEWCGWDDPGDDGTYYDPYRLDVAVGENFVSRAWVGARWDGAMAAAELTVTEIPDRSPSITPDLDGKPGVPWSMSDRPIPGDFQFSYMDTPWPEDSGV